MLNLADQLADGHPPECWECVQHGCHTADDKPIPCNCETFACDCNDECICDCHKWVSLVRKASHYIRSAEERIKALEEMLVDSEQREDQWFYRYVGKATGRSR